MSKNRFGLIFVALAVLFVGGCSTLQGVVAGDYKPCVEKVAVAKATVAQVVSQANTAYDGGLVTLGTYQKLDDITDKANVAVTSALQMCANDESGAVRLLKTVDVFVLETQQLLKEEGREP